jgi:hypothetical protein
MVLGGCATEPLSPRHKAAHNIAMPEVLKKVISDHRPRLSVGTSKCDNEGVSLTISIVESCQYYFGLS